MEFVKSAINRCIRRFVSDQEVESPVTKLDLVLNAVHKIVTWQEVELTLSALILVHINFWIILAFEIQFYSMLSCLMLSLIVGQLYVDNVGSKKEPGPYSNSGEKICMFVKTRTLYLKKLRRENPAAFCIMMSGFFILLSFVSRYLTGLQLTYLSVMSLFIGPLLSVKSPVFLEKFFQNMILYEGVLEESDLLFEDFEECEHLDLEVPEADLITDSFSSLIETEEEIVMPSHSEVDGNGEELSESKLMELEPQGNSTSSSDSEIKNINFIPSHFENDSSSDEDNYLPHIHSQDEILSETITTAPKTKSKETNSDSEFEIIDYCELSETSTPK